MEGKSNKASDITTKCKSFMGKFWKSREVQCKAAKEEFAAKYCKEETFPTGSKYTGLLLGKSLHGSGTYTFPNGTIYQGEFKHNQFHGYGEIIYKNGVIVCGFWEEGGIDEPEIIFPSGLVYEEEEWMYCKMPDRRFAAEYKNGVQAAGNSYLTDEQPTDVIPEDHYNSGDGYYDPKRLVVKKMNDLSTVTRAPVAAEQDWIIRNCRYGNDRSIGPSPHLYEKWLKPQLRQTPVTYQTARVISDTKYARSRFVTVIDSSDSNASF